MEQIKKAWEPLHRFCKDSFRLLRRCHKPSRKEFKIVSIATLYGFCIMGFIGYTIKLIHIPINNIIV